MTKIKDNYDCIFSLTHDLIGGKWKLQIVWHIMQGDNRFSELKRVLPGISEKVLYSNLRELEETGIIRKEVKEDQAVRAVFYYLGRNEQEIALLVNLLSRFSSNYAKENDIMIQA